MRRYYEVSPDGGRFLVAERVELPHEPVRQMAVVHDWLAELERLVPRTRR